MSEIKKMYENCNIKKYRLLDRDNKLKWVYPPFTAEKQLEIVKMILFSTWWMNLKILPKEKLIELQSRIEKELTNIHEEK